MTYIPLYIDSTGLHLPTYPDILSDLIQKAQATYGQDIYLGTDSQDYQLLTIFAAKIYDAVQGLQIVYNSRSPLTAIGATLDGLVQLSGISRLLATFSTCLVTLTGTPGTIINGSIRDISGYSWALPTPITIGVGGTVTVTATCITAGAITASPGDLSIIATPTYGWIGVTNTESAILGSRVESDSQLRGRQADSASLPSLTMLAGTRAAIAALPGVTRFVIYENDTSVVDSLGLPQHSITTVVEGGDPTQIATALWSKKGLGCFTNGTTPIVLTDSYGLTTTISFYRPSYVDIDVVVNVHSLAGYTTAVTFAIKAAVAAYLSSLNIGNSVQNSSLWGAALSVQALTNPIFSITSLTSCIHLGTPGVIAIPITFNQVSQGNVVYITVNVT